MHLRIGGIGKWGPRLYRFRWVAGDYCPSWDVPNGDSAGRDDSAGPNRYARADEGFGAYPGVIAYCYRLGDQRHINACVIVRASAQVSVLAKRYSLANNNAAKVVDLAVVAKAGEVAHFKQPGVIDLACTADGAAAPDFGAEEAQQKCPPARTSMETVTVKGILDDAPKKPAYFSPCGYRGDIARGGSHDAGSWGLAILFALHSP